MSEDKGDVNKLDFLANNIAPPSDPYIMRTNLSKIRSYFPSLSFTHTHSFSHDFLFFLVSLEKNRKVENIIMTQLKMNSLNPLQNHLNRILREESTRCGTFVILTS